MGRIITYPDREAWLEGRRKFIGSSDARAILGHGYAGENALAVYADKVSDEPRRISGSQASLFEAGNELEAAILKLFSTRTGKAVNRYEVPSTHLHPTIPFIAASLDGWIEGEDGFESVEAKFVNSHMAHEWRGEHAPLKHAIQTQFQLLVTQWKRGHVVGLVDGELIVFTVERNDKFCEWLTERVEQFWANHIVPRVPPQPDGSDSSAEAIRRLFPEDNGEMIDLPTTFDELVAKLDRIKAREKKLEEMRGELENRLMLAMGEASYGLLTDGRCVSLKLQERRGYYVQPTSFRVLRFLKKAPGTVKPKHRRGLAC